MSKSPVYVTTSIAYVNADPHIGFAMECIEADVINRFYKMKGHQTYFLTGTDEHGIKLQRTAEDKGITPRELCDKNAAKFKTLKELLHLSNDDFIRTSDQQKHWPAVIKIWKRLIKNGDIYKDSYEAYYCSGCESFKTEKELVDGYCPNHQTKPEMLIEENYFFRLSKYSKQIQELIESKKLEILPEFRSKEILNILKEGLQDVSFSRPRKSLTWGIPVPDDDEQVMYVWCDALTNYISAIGFADDQDLFKKFWPGVIHVIGKDIVRFHAAIWPAMLMSAGIATPEKIFIHGFITSEGHKMSKSLGNVVDPQIMVDKYGVDALRYYLLSEIPVGLDGDFSKKLFEERYTANLGNNLGNLLNRVLLMTSKYLDSKIPDKSDPLVQHQTYWEKYISEMDKLNLHKGLQIAFDWLNDLNKLIDDTKPWVLAKEKNSAKLFKVLYNLLESLRQVSVMLRPFMPETSLKIRQQLGLCSKVMIDSGRKWGGEVNWEHINETYILFPKLED